MQRREALSPGYPGRSVAFRLSVEESDGQKLRFKRLSLAVLFMPHAVEERQGVGRRENRGVGKRPAAPSRPSAVRAGDSWRGDSGMRGRDWKCREAPPKGPSVNHRRLGLERRHPGECGPSNEHRESEEAAGLRLNS